MKKYKVVKPWGNYREGQIVNNSSIEIRRKLQEGGCLESCDQKKMNGKEYENKSLKDDYDNKKGGK